MPRTFTRACPVCGAEFAQQGKPGALRRMCSEACSKERLRRKKAARCDAWYNGVRRVRFDALIKAGASREYANWGARGGKVRYEAALEVQQQEK